VGSVVITWFVETLMTVSFCRPPDIDQLATNKRLLKPSKAVPPEGLTTVMFPTTQLVQDRTEPE
jgi:hypothetical protein